MCVNVLPAYISAHHVQSWKPQRHKIHWRTGASDGCEPSCGYWKSNQSPPQRIVRILTTETALWLAVCFEGYVRNEKVNLPGVALS